MMLLFELLPFCYMSFYVFDRKFYMADRAADLYHTSAYYLGHMAASAFAAFLAAGPFITCMQVSISSRDPVAVTRLFAHACIRQPNEVMHAWKLRRLAFTDATNGEGQR